MTTLATTRLVLKRAVLSLVAVGALSGTLLAGSAPAEAKCNGCAFAAAGVGGLVLGAMIASAAQPRYAEPAYVEDEPACYRQRVRFYDAYGYPHHAWRTVCR